MSLYDQDDFVIDGYCDEEEKLRKIYIALSAHRGSFIFDRTLGSEVWKAEGNGQLMAAVREALDEIPEAESEGIITNQGNAYAVIKLGGHKYNVPIKGGEV